MYLRPTQLLYIINKCTNKLVNITRNERFICYKINTLFSFIFKVFIQNVSSNKKVKNKVKKICVFLMFMNGNIQILNAFQKCNVNNLKQWRLINDSFKLKYILFDWHLLTNY